MADDGALRHMFEPEWLEGDTLSGEHILRMLALLHPSRHAVFPRHCRALGPGGMKSHRHGGGLDHAGAT